MRFWVDMDNAPHVHILRPLIVELQRQGHKVDITARDYGQTLPLLHMYGLNAVRIGRHAGPNGLKKRLFFVFRTLSLFFYAMGKGYCCAVCHGSRSLLVAGALLRIPVVTMSDYEYASIPRAMAKMASLVMIPDVIPPAEYVRKGIPVERIVQYPGLKEDLYIHNFEPDPSFIGELRIDRRRVVVLVRPPATMAHYAVKESGVLFYEVLSYLGSLVNIHTIVLPRTIKQDEAVRAFVRDHNYTNVHFPARVYDGPSLIWYSDVVISGGGTMNREAAALGVPVVSIYQGPVGAVDQNLVETGRLSHVKSLAEFKKIELVKSDRDNGRRSVEVGARLCAFVIDRIIRTSRNGRGEITHRPVEPASRNG